VMLPGCSTPIRSITDRRSLTPSSFTRSPVGSSRDERSLAGGLRAYHVAPMYRSGEGRVSSPVARHLRGVSSEHPDLATYLLVQAYQHLTLVLYDGVYRHFTWVDLSTRSWLPTTVMLVVAVSAHALTTTLAGEATLPGELCTFTDVLEESIRNAHLRGILLAEQQVLSVHPRTAAQLHRRPRVAPER